MRSQSLGFKLSVFLVASVAIALAIGAGMHLLLRKTEQSTTTRNTRVIQAKNATYQLLEAFVNTQSVVQNTLRLKDPDEIEKSIEVFKKTATRAQDQLRAIPDIPQAVTGRLRALTEADQSAIDKFLLGENAEAFEVLINTVPPLFEALLQGIREYSLTVESAAKAEAEAGERQLRRTLFAAGIGSALLVGLLVLFGWSFRRQVIGKLSQLSNTLEQASDQVAGAASQVSTSSQQLADGASEQAASLEETSASLNEMSSMSKRNAEVAGRANELARTARKAADNGAQDISLMHESMNAIKSASDEIAKIIKTIDEIAFQTNILALNAAVEAARAGEAGMGFAVVADEVRALAQRSAQASRETSGKIEAAISKTAQGVEISTRVAATLNEIVEAVRKVDDLISEVAKASGEQTSGVDQINTAVNQMDRITQGNAANAEESAAAAQQLKSQSHALREAVHDLSRLIGLEMTDPTAPSSGTALLSSRPSPSNPKSSKATFNTPKALPTRGSSAHNEAFFKDN